MPDTKQHVVVHISTASIFKVVGVALALWFLYTLREVVVVVFIAMLFATALEPAVDWLSRRRMPRAFGVALLYLALFFVFSLVIVLLAPLVAEEIVSLTKNFPGQWRAWVESFQISEPKFTEALQQVVETLPGTMREAAGNIFVFIQTIFGNLISFVLVLVLTFYFLIQEDAIRRTFRIVTPPSYQAYASDLITRMQQRLGAWLRGTVLLGLIVGGLVLVGLWVLGVRYAVVLAVVAGILEFIPYVGPVLAAIPGVFFAMTDSPWKGVSALVLYWLIQQLENHVIVPKVMQKAVGLNPVVVILVMLVAAKLAGFAGVLVAVPTAAALSVWIKDIYESSTLGPPRPPVASQAP